MASEKYKRYSVLISSTVSFTMCFMVWMMLAVVGIPVKEELGLTEIQFSTLAVLPVLSGSFIRVPLGIWTDKHGGRIVMFALMMVSTPVIFLMGHAYACWHFLSIGPMMGSAGDTFSAGTPYAARWSPKEQQGLAMGVLGVGNAGSAANKFLVLALIAHDTWHFVPTVYVAITPGTALLFWFTNYHDPKHLVPSSASLKERLALLKDLGVLRYSQYHSVVFGSYAALALWMTHYYVDKYGPNLKTAALLATCFSLPGGVLRVFGGCLSSRFGAHRATQAVMWVLWVCFFPFSYPQTDSIIHDKDGDISMHIGLNVVLFTVLIFIAGIVVAVGKASVFKFVTDDYPHNIDATSGVVGLAGGLGGFLLPIMFGMPVDLTGVRTTPFVLLYGAVCFSLVWMYFSLKAKAAHRQTVQRNFLDGLSIAGGRLKNN